MRARGRHVGIVGVQKREAQMRREERWRGKTERSPFHVDLVAEQERIDEVRAWACCSTGRSVSLSLIALSTSVARRYCRRSLCCVLMLL